MNFAHHHRRIGILLGALTVATLLSACVSSPKVSQAKTQSTDRIIDPVKYKQAKQMVNQANRLFIRKRYRQALALVDKSLATHDTFEGHYLKGSILFHLKKENDALKSYLRAEELQPLNQQLLLSLGVVYTSLGRLDEAQKRYLKLAENFPDEPVYPFKVGTTYKNLREYEKAEEYLKKADVSDFKYRDQLYLQLGDVSLELKKYDEAEEYFKKARQINPKLQVAARGGSASKVGRVLDQGNEYFRQKKYEQALREYEKAKGISPTSAGPYLLAGSTLLVLERYPEARQNLVKATELNPADAKGYSLLGSVYQKEKKTALALKTLQTGLKIAPESYDIYNKIGQVHQDNGDARKAIDNFLKALKIKSDYVPARTNLAFALLEDKRYSDAKREFATAAKLDPSDKDLQKAPQLVDMYVVLDRGDRLYQAGRAGAALKEYEKAVKIRDDVPVVYNALGQAQFQIKKYKPAEASYLKARELDKNNIPAIQGLLRVYTATRSPKRGPLLAEFQELTKNNIIAAITIGRLKEDEGKLGEAEKYYLGLKKSHPDEDVVDRRLGYVYYKMGLAENERERYPAALALFQKAEKHNPDIPQLADTKRVVQENIAFAKLLPIFNRAERAYARRQYPEALKLYEQAYSQLNRPSLLVKIANCHIAMGNESKGQRILEEAAAAPGAQVEISEAIYTNFLKKGDTGKAEQGFKEILARSPEAYFSLYKLGIIQLQKSDYNAAIDYFNRSLVYKPDFAVGYIARGVALYGKGEPEKARLEFEQALKIDAESPIAAFNLGVMLYNDNLVDKAEKVFADLHKEHPAFPDPLYQLSYIYYLRGDFDKARETMQRCVAIQAEPRFYYALAQIEEKNYENNRSPQVAQELKGVYQEIITRYPDSPYADEAKRKLLTLNPDQRLVQPYPVGRVSRAPILFNNDMIMVEPAQVRAVDASTKKERWKVSPGAVRDVLVDHNIYVLSPGKVGVYESYSGLLLREIPVDQKADQLIGDRERLAVSVPGARGARSLTVFDADGKRVAERAGAGRFYHAGGFYRIGPNKGKTALWLEPVPQPAEASLADKVTDKAREMLGDRAKSLLGEKKAEERQKPVETEPVVVANLPADFAGGQVDILRQGDYLYVFRAGRRLLVFSGQGAELKEEKNIKTDAGKLRFAGDAPVLVSRGKVVYLDADGDTDKEVALKVPAQSAASVRTVGRERIVYFGNDRKIRSVDLDGKEIWTADSPAPGGVYSLFY